MTDTSTAERIAEAPRGVDADIASYKAIQLAMSQLERDIKKLKAERDLVKKRIITKLKINENVETTEKLVLTRNSVPVLRVSVYPHSSVSADFLKEFYPEIYARALVVRQEVRFNIG